MDKTILISLPIEDLQTLIIDSVKSCLKHNHQSSDEGVTTEILDVKEASDFLKIAIPTIYAMTSSRTIPHSKRGKKLYFKRSDLLEWIEGGRKKTKNQLQNQN